MPPMPSAGVLLMRWLRMRWQGVISTLIEDDLMIRGSSHPR